MGTETGTETGTGTSTGTAPDADLDEHPGPDPDPAAGLRGEDGLTTLLARQQGVVSRTQLRALGLRRSRIETLLRRRELVPVHPGVYVSHTGEPTPAQRRWAAVLHAAPAALHLAHALPDPPTTGPVDVAIDWTRRVSTRPGVRVHRVRGLAPQVRWNLSPPRVRVELATLARAAGAASDLDAIAVVTAAVGSRRTTAARLGRLLAERPTTRRRALLAALLEDLAAGTHSVLEHGFLTRVVRAHGLPEPTARQARRSEGAWGTEYRDVEYADHGCCFELDGVHHDDADARDRDADRDLDELAAGSTTVRLRWRQVFGTPCRTAERTARVLQRGGWAGRARPCSPTCPLASGGRRERRG